MDFEFEVPAVYWTQARGVLESITLPVGFRTDLASIPQAVWSIPGFQPNGPVIIGALPHDGLYGGQAITTGEPWTRADADLVLLEGMQNAGMPLTVQEAIYKAVREFGGPAWDAGHAV